MSVDVVEQLANGIKILNGSTEDLDNKEIALDCLEDWVGQINMASNFHKIGGVTALWGRPIPPSARARRTWPRSAARKPLLSGQIPPQIRDSAGQGWGHHGSREGPVRHFLHLQRQSLWPVRICRPARLECHPPRHPVQQQALDQGVFLCDRRGPRGQQNPGGVGGAGLGGPSSSRRLTMKPTNMSWVGWSVWPGTIKLPGTGWPLNRSLSCFWRGRSMVVVDMIFFAIWQLCKSDPGPWRKRGSCTKITITWILCGSHPVPKRKTFTIQLVA